jgi:hypothetical protein
MNSAFCFSPSHRLERLGDDYFPRDFRRIESEERDQSSGSKPSSRHPGHPGSN